MKKSENLISHVEWKATTSMESYRWQNNLLISLPLPIHDNVMTMYQMNGFV